MTYARSKGTLAVTGLAGLLVLVTGCTASRPNREPEATPSTAASVDLGRALEDYIANGSAPLGTINSVVVDVDGARRLELYRNGGGPNHYSHVWSVTKSVVSTLVGIAIAEGKISSLDATLPELLPDHAATMTVDQRSVTLRQLLTMSGRFSDGHGDRSPSRKVASILKLPLQATPGTQHIHSDPGAQLVSAIVAEATGMTTLDYARKKLFGPLGISSTPAYTEVAAWGRIDIGSPQMEAFDNAEFAWAVTEDGISNGCCMLKLKPEDMVKIGRLYLDSGQWDGRQVLPAEWVQSPDAGWSHSGSQTSRSRLHDSKLLRCFRGRHKRKERLDGSARTCDRDLRIIRIRRSTRSGRSRGCRPGPSRPASRLR
jgi:CubicO group peptidase (beta-lactamase class C family)